MAPSSITTQTSYRQQSPHRFRFGIACNARTRAELIEQARKAEDLGFSTLVFEDHLFKTLSPIPAMVLAAEVTTTLRVGSYVFGNDFRHPVQLARDAATVDLLTSGRLELGLGTGYLHSDYAQAGLDLDRPGTRVSRLEEAIQVLKGAFANESYSFSGQHYHVHELVGKPKPVQQPYPPLMIGGGSKRMLTIAAREADIVSVNARTTEAGRIDFTSLTAEATEAKIAWLRAAAGDRFEELEYNILVADVQITQDRRRVAEEGMRAYRLEGILTLDQIMEAPGILMGSVDQIVEKLLAQREHFGFSYYVALRGMDALAPVVARLDKT